MKNFIAVILLLSSVSAFSSDAGVMGAMKTMFREGFYFGSTPDQDMCSVRFQYFSDKAIVTAQNLEISVSRIIPAGSAYRFQSGRRELLSSDNQSTFRSLAVNESQTYTVTAMINEFGEEVPVECIISL